MSIIKGHGAGEVSTGFYPHLLDQSLKFNAGDAQYLSRTYGAASTTYTVSMWVKRGVLSTYQYLWSSNNNGLAFDVTTDRLYYFSAAGGQTFSTAVFRDPSAFYHVVFKNSGGTAVVYVNNVQVISATGVALSTTANATSIGKYWANGGSSSNYYFDGYIAEVNWVDSAAKNPSDFGETKDGIWVPKEYSGSYGSHGFHLTFKDDVVSEGFNTVTYEGTGSATANFISGIGFAPNLVWIKNRDATADHALYDSLRTNMLSSNSTAVEVASSGVVALNADGFGIGSADARLNSAASFVAWCWEAGGTPTADNSAGAGATPTAGSVKIDGSNLSSALAGTIPATRLSANTTNGFSVVTYTGTGSAATVAHGLGATPKWMIIKNRGVATWWTIYHTSLGATKYVRLNSTSAEIDNSNVWNDTEPTSSVFTVATVNDVNASGNTYVAYCFAEISGYSKFGSFTGNGGSQAIDVGFPVAWVMLKRTSNASSWAIFDNTRGGNPVANFVSFPNRDQAESQTGAMVFSGDTFNDNGSVSDNGTTVLYMAFADTREAAFFKDVSSNGNHFTPVNLDYRDSVPDVPTNNFATLNPLRVNQQTQVFAESNLKFSSSQSSTNPACVSTFAVNKGKWYWEVLVVTAANASNSVGIATTTGDLENDQYAGYQKDWAFSYQTDGNKRNNNSASSYGSSFTDGDIIAVMLDLDNGNLYFRKNNTIQASGAAAFASLSDTFTSYSLVYGGGAQVYNFGQDSSFAGNKSTANTNADGNGFGSFAYAPPSGYLALCSQNLPNAAIIDGTDNFNTLLYTGDGNSTKSISGVGFSPDWVWVKNRASTYDHALSDSVRGASAAYLSSNNTASESTYGKIYGDLTSFDSDGFSVAEGSDSTYPDAAFNQSSQAYVAWNWLAGTAFSNDASATGVGTIDSEGQVNTTAGFSIVKHDNGSGTRTVAHGLSSAPEIIFEKKRDATGDWIVQFTVIDGTSDYMRLNTTVAKTDGSNALPTATVYSPYVGGGADCLAYCFHSVEGYSKVGSYVGNGNAAGPFVFTGFRPAWILFKNTSAATNWEIYDTTRQPSNVALGPLYANLSSAEESHATLPALDILSNGFKPRSTWAEFNTNGQTYVYIAFAEQPFKYANAR